MILQRNLVIAPALLLALMVALAACGSDATSDQDSVQATAEAEKMEAEAMAMAMEEEKMKADAEAMAMEEEKMKADAEAMAMEEAKMKAESEAMMMEDGLSLKLDFSGVETLANGFHYEGWAIIDGSAVSTGKFNVGSNGDLVSLDGSAKEGGVFHAKAGLESATDIVITIEPSGDVDDVPAATHFVSGSITGGAVSLSVGHAAALGDDFSSAAGVYILATPTNGANTDENSGIWFLDLSSGSPEVGLELPVLPEGWVYEGWNVIDGVPVSSGRFTAVDEVDFDDPYSGTEDGPPFPGEDYLVNAPEGLTFPTDLAGTTAVISVEPSPDDSSAPFTLKPLVGAIAADATDHQTYQLGSNVADLPSGTATIGDF